MAEGNEHDDVALHRGMALFGALVSGAFVNLSVRLTQRLAVTPGFADDFAQMADEIIRDMQNAVPTGYSIDEEADANGQAIREVRKSLDDILRQLRERPQS